MRHGRRPATATPADDRQLVGPTVSRAAALAAPAPLRVGLVTTSAAASMYSVMKTSSADRVGLCRRSNWADMADSSESDGSLATLAEAGEENSSQTWSRDDGEAGTGGLAEGCSADCRKVNFMTGKLASDTHPVPATSAVYIFSQTIATSDGAPDMCAQPAADRDAERVDELLHLHFLRVSDVSDSFEKKALASDIHPGRLRLRCLLLSFGPACATAGVRQRPRPLTIASLLAPRCRGPPPLQHRPLCGSAS
mmetsp:Transcript_62079/g.178073  ORF Transcript_62079/g.178073 Transcript_62079/m.178073 type:complete len:252 (-) Transcript_62079:296-1051(-)